MADPTATAAQRHIFSCRYGFAQCRCAPFSRHAWSPHWWWRWSHGPSRRDAYWTYRGLRAGLRRGMTRRALALYILRNSGVRVWLADRLVAIAGRLNPQKPWLRVTEPIGFCEEEDYGDAYRFVD